MCEDAASEGKRKKRRRASERGAGTKASHEARDPTASPARSEIASTRAVGLSVSESPARKEGRGKKGKTAKTQQAALLYLQHGRGVECRSSRRISSVAKRTRAAFAFLYDASASLCFCVC